VTGEPQKPSALNVVRFFRIHSYYFACRVRF